MRIRKTLRLMGLFLLAISCCTSVVVADDDQADQAILLWPKDRGSKDREGLGTPKPDRGDGHTRITNVTIPSMRYFPAPQGKGPQPLVILCPGGGYSHMVITKMIAIAKWLNGHGISACVLQYRTPKKREDAFQDIQRAIRIVRSRAEGWNVDPKRIGVMGSSAGGHLAARASAAVGVTSYQAVDEIDQVSCLPDFAVLLYPAYMNRGDDLSPEFSVSDKIGPTLIVSAQDDIKHFPGGVVYAKALEEAGASIRVHFFEKGGHGFGLEPKQKPLSTWPDLFLQWLKDMEILKEAAEEENLLEEK